MSERAPAGRTLLRCHAYLRPCWSWIPIGFLCILCMHASDACSLIAPQLVRAVVDRGIGGRGASLGRPRRPAGAAAAPPCG